VKRYSLHVPANIHIAAAVRNISEYIFTEVGFSEVQISRLKLVFDEIFMNAVKYGSMEGSLLDIVFEFENNTLKVLFEDEGSENGISAEDLQQIISQQKTNTDPEKKSGRGLAQIAGKWADDLKIWNGTKGGLCIAFYKNLKEETPDTPKDVSSSNILKSQKTKDLPSTVMSVSGEIDNINISEHVRDIDTFLEKEKIPRLLILDLRDLRFCNSSFIAKTVSWHQQICDRGGDLVIQNIPKNIFEIFELVGITKIIHITFDAFESEDEHSKKTQSGDIKNKKVKN
jgi:anti-anti-sigma factor